MGTYLHTKNMSVNCLTIDEIFSERKKIFSERKKKGYDDSEISALIKEQEQIYTNKKDKYAYNLACKFGNIFEFPEVTDTRTNRYLEFNSLVENVSSNNYKSVTAKISFKNSVVFLALSIFNNKFDLFEYIKTNYFSDLAVIFGDSYRCLQYQHTNKKIIYTAIISSKNIAYINSFYRDIENKERLMYGFYYNLPSKEVFEYLKKEKLVSDYDKAIIEDYYKFLNGEEIPKGREKVIYEHYYIHDANKKKLKKKYYYYLIERHFRVGNDVMHVDYYKLLLKYLDYVKNIEISSSIIRNIFFENYIKCYNIIILTNLDYKDESEYEYGKIMLRLAKHFGEINQKYVIYKLFYFRTVLSSDLVQELIKMLF